MKTEKDWSGNSKTTFVTLGASNHTDHERAEHDYYATEPKAADLICEVEEFEGGIWENCCGEGHLSKRFIELGNEVVSTDLIDRGYGQGCVDFFECDKALMPNIVTNPHFILNHPQKKDKGRGKETQEYPEDSVFSLRSRCTLLHDMASVETFRGYS